MRIFDFISLTLESTRGNILRTFLSIISVVIGVFSFVFVVSLNEGMAKNVMTIVERFGGLDGFEIRASPQNMVRIKNNPSMGKYKNFNIRYPVTLKLIDSLNSNFPEAYFSTEYFSNNFIKKNDRELNLFGVDDKYFEFYKYFKLDTGRFLNILDIKNKNNVAVVNSAIYKNKFSNDQIIGNLITIGNYQFEIIGTHKNRNSYNKKGVFIPISVATTLFPSPARGLKILAKVKDINKMHILRNRLKTYLDLTFEKDMFRVEDKEKQIEDFNSMSNSYSNLILLFSILMLVTGGIGIMNIMLASIKERLREIGIKKAVGAKNRDIFIQFFMETLLLFFIGGGIGIIIAVFSVEKAAEFIIKGEGWRQAEAIISFNVIAISIIFTSITGLVFGLLPAIKASKIMPIDSLRYE